jgi:hypothetical protein
MISELPMTMPSSVLCASVYMVMMILIANKTIINEYEKRAKDLYNFGKPAG